MTFEESIDRDIQQMESKGYLFEEEDLDGIGFWSPADENNNCEYKMFSSWHEVENFLKEH